MDNILDYIPRGYDNRVSFETLEDEIGWKRRAIQEHLELSDTLVIAMDGGVFIPSSDDEVLVKRWKAREKKRALATMSKLKKADKWLTENDDTIFNANVYRMVRLIKGKTLAEVSRRTAIPVGYLKRVERGSGSEVVKERIGGSL